MVWNVRVKKTTKGVGGGHKVGNMGRHRSWMAPNPSERNIHKGSLPHSCQHVCWSLQTPMIFKWHSNWLGTFGFPSNYNASNSSLLQKVCSSFATSLHYINRGSSIVLLLNIQSGLSMMSNPRQKVFPCPTPYWIRNHYLKSNKLQYNTLARWVDGTNDSSTKCLMFQAFAFFHTFL